MVEFMRKIVPEAIFRFPAYPPSYAKRSEFLLETALRLLRTSNVKGTEVTVNYGYPASYAQFVNEMSGVNWSKPGSEGHFYESGRAFLRSIFKPEIQKALKGITGKKKEGPKTSVRSVLEKILDEGENILIDDLVERPELSGISVKEILRQLSDLIDDGIIDGSQATSELKLFPQGIAFGRIILRKKRKK